MRTLEKLRHWMSEGSLQRRWLKRIVLIFSALLILSAVALATWIFQLDRDIKARFAEKRFAPPVEFYSAPEVIRVGVAVPPEFFDKYFSRKNYRVRSFGQPLQPGDYSLWAGADCASLLPQEAQASTLDGTSPARCLAFKSTAQSETDSVQIAAFDLENRVLAVFAGTQLRAVESIELEPELFAQYYGDNPVLRSVVRLGDTPTQCLNALLAIEDSQFLEHPGISVTGLMRAVIVNLRSGRRAQGGSTITQQLVKNYFLSDERTIKRKLTEIIMAFLVEKHASKDDILETYINLIYMGQNGPFQVRGFAAAANHYFSRPLSELSLDQCALLSAVLNSPGLYNPFKSPERAMKRRERVIDRMLELQMIDTEQAAQANAAPLPAAPARGLTEPAPYFVQAVRRELTSRGIDESQGLRVFTTLNLRAQESAHQVVRASLDRLEKTLPHLQKLKAQGKNLEAVLISANPQTGSVEALVGGRGFLVSPYNRAIESHRQVGSVMKPFVFLTAFETMQKNGDPYTPLTTLHDVGTTHRFEGQTWTPRNYDGTYNGDLPLYWALKESLNAATVNLGMDVGLSNVIDTARRLGLRSTIKPLPSLTLGAFELTPLEVLQAYGSLANLGVKVDLSLVRRIEDLGTRPLYTYEPIQSRVVSAEATAQLVGVMKQGLISGTGRAARAVGFTHPAAGKTGTTNDKKDAWFAGFTPFHAAVVWVGYDDNTPHNLTGASGAVPLWANYMKAYATQFPANDFAWPESVERVTLSPEQQDASGAPQKAEGAREDIELIFRKGQAPSRGFFN